MKNIVIDNMPQTRKERVDVHMGIQYLHKDKPVDAKILNMSSSGLCFQGEGLLKPKESIKLKIPLLNTGEQITLKTQVIWCEPLNPRYKNILLGKTKKPKKGAKAKKAKGKKLAKGKKTAAKGKKIPDNVKTKTGIRFLELSLEKNGVISDFINRRKDEIIRQKIGLINLPTQ